MLTANSSDAIAGTCLPHLKLIARARLCSQLDRLYNTYSGASLAPFPFVASTLDALAQTDLRLGNAGMEFFGLIDGFDWSAFKVL
ncbi:MAG: hypothetical protein CBB77_03940 [Hyphomonas sp. TMED17]|nr:MAG: hypothetical protein CBB77_03940 [Hyphomonas sp. TMED17]